MKEIDLYNFIMELQMRYDRPITVGDVNNDLRIPRATLYRMLNVLIDQRMIMRVKKGQYAITSYWLVESLVNIHRQYDTKKWIKVL